MRKRLLTLTLIASLAIACMPLMTGCRSGVNGEVYVYSYGDYFDEEILTQFEEETGIRVIIDTYDTAEEMYTVLENNASCHGCMLA